MHGGHKMAEGDVATVNKVFNYVCSLGGFAEITQLSTFPSPLAKKCSESSVISWYESEKKAGSFDSVSKGLLLTTDERGNVVGIRINLKKRLCLYYVLKGSCYLGSKCQSWHICKMFLEGTCKHECGRSHNFHDDDNKGKTAELGFEKKTNEIIKSIIASSLPQICPAYVKGECAPRYCPRLHICPKQALAVPCQCPLSHDFALPHNRNVLEQFALKPPGALKVEVVRCNVLLPKQHISGKSAKLTQGKVESSVNNNWSRQATFKDHGKKDTAKAGRSSEQKGAMPVFLSGLVEEAAETAPMATGSQHQKATDPLPGKVLNYIYGKGGHVTLSELLHHPSPLTKKKFSIEDTKIWLQVQAQCFQSPKICLLKNKEGEILGARVQLRKKMCLFYPSKDSCSKSTFCQFWHICKRYLEEKCPSGCGLSHDFHDEGNMKLLLGLGLEKHSSGTIKKVVANSLPQVCLNYLNNECLSACCPYLHICGLAAQGNPCSCKLSHELANGHNMQILQQYELVPQPSKLSILYSNILIPKKQNIFDESMTIVGCTELKMKSASDIPSLMSFELGDEGKKKMTEPKKPPQKKKSKKKAHQEEVKEGLSDTRKLWPEGDHSLHSTFDNENVEKPDLYSNSKFAMNLDILDLSGRKDFSKEDPMPGGYVPKAEEENLISLSDDEWQGVGGAMDDVFSSNYELLSQVDNLFFDDLFEASNFSGSLSQQSGISSTSDLMSAEQDGVTSQKVIADAVFQTILRDYNGQVSFSEISQHQDLFQEIIDIAAWFKENKHMFMTIESREGEIVEVRCVHHKARVCFKYLLAQKGCKNPNCFSYHVCKLFLANGVCPLAEKCRFSQSHSLKSQHNRKITNRLRLKGLSEDQLRILISFSVPEVCLEYNDGSCQRGFRCTGIHICKRFLMNQCKKDEKLCPFGHQSSLETSHAKLVLSRYNFSKVQPSVVLKVMLIRRRRRKKVVKVKAKQEKANMPHETGIAEKPPIKPEWKMPEPQNIQR
ncbi:PREDICTED: uncharacterized protein LOC107357618 [Acropora digitifera]|uniref:uncharacterized protein LOC107357618 n=1 Tax=Acropora digitifera TaxID=70779 RepID=UPI00077A6BD7|nr:PREDICTED: uncharacterized protein LOC107357618 [Acropora digitifera]